MRGTLTHPLFRTAVAAAVAVSGCPRDASAVILLDREQRNLTPPAGSLLAAWNLEATYAGFNATPISAHQFVSARHIGAGAGGAVNFQGNNYLVTAATDIAGTDLRVFTISGAFPTFASLWDTAIDGSEAGKPMAVFGRGTQRGAAIVAAIPPGPVAAPGNPALPITPTATPANPVPAPIPPLPGSVRGWSWGTADGQQSWGRNIVDGVAIDNDFGELLSYSFSAGAGKVADEAGLSGGDSGGGVFIFSQGQWKLAGVNLGVDGPFNYSPGGAYFNANIFDARGLYVGTPANHEFIPYSDSPVEGSSYSSRIGGANLAAIRLLIGGAGSTGGGPTVVPEPTALFAMVGVALIGRRRR
jgi:hypothetical protein